MAGLARATLRLAVCHSHGRSRNCAPRHLGRRTALTFPLRPPPQKN
jgi:hypothetical protein